MKSVALLILASSALWSAGRPERFALILEDSPLAAQVQSRKDLQNAAAREQVEARHQTLKGALAERGFRVTASDPLLSNAIFVQAPAGSERALQALPGVAYVEKLRPLKRHMNRALDLMNIPQAWSAVNGSRNAGAGVRIAILDTGIDQAHPAFNDSALQYPEGFPKCDQARGECAYVNRKVIAARSYVDMLVGTEPEFSRPDDVSPRDRVGHGTAVAMIAAGVPSTGPPGEVTGVAPGAWLGNYKVFGSPGVNGPFTYDDVIIRALTDALQDGMHIALLTFGTDIPPALWGPRDAGSTCDEGEGVPCDWRAAAVENAIRMGLAVVVSAGNDGDLATRYPAYNSINSPGSAPSAITVGATTNSHILYQSVRVEGSGIPAELQRVNALFGDGPRPAGTLTAPARDVSQLGDNGRLCSPLGANALSGAIALIERGDCQLDLKVIHAQRAGAVGAILYQQQGLEGLFPMKGLLETGIPAVLIGNRGSVALRNYVSQQPQAQVTLDTAFNEIQTFEFDTVGVFSSRGPSIREHLIKPEVVAVGTDLYVATQRYDPNGELWSSSGFTAVQGTSFAAAAAAGVAAMVKQRLPNLTPAQLKSAIVNTADPNDLWDYDGNRQVEASVLDVGAGKLDANLAIRTNATVDPATLSFGVLRDQLPAAKTLTLYNHSDQALNLRLTVLRAPTATPTLLLSANEVSVPAGGQGMVNVRLEGTIPEPGVYEGLIQIDGSAVPLRIPFVYVVPDGVPFSILPLAGDGFERETGATVTLLVKVTDRYGVPVPGLTTRFQSTRGEGVVTEEGQETDDLGIGWADITTGAPGEQEFYVAIGGDQEFGVFFSGRARPIPTIAAGGVVDAASNQARAGYAPGSYVTLFGTALSDVPLAFGTPYLPLSLAGFSVSFDDPARNLSVPGRLTFVSEGQINVQIPWELQGSRSAFLKVSVGDTSSPVVSIPIASYSPALFEYTEGSGARLAAAVRSDGAVIGSSTAATRNDVISLYANGLGPVDNQPASGEVGPSNPLATVRTVPTVTIGGRPAEVLFAGLAPGFVGLYQLNVRVPADAPTGVQPVVITAGDVSSTASNVPIQ